jgi:hypothetical protein
VYQHAAQVNITAFTNAQHTVFTPTAMLSGREPDGSGHLPASVVLPGISDRGDQCSGNQRSHISALSVSV